jgi:hypothetical protein
MVHSPTVPLVQYIPSRHPGKSGVLRLSSLIMMLSARDDGACHEAFLHFTYDIVNALVPRSLSKCPSGQPMGSEIAFSV